MQSSGIRVKLKVSDRESAADASATNGRSTGNGPEVVTISDEDDDIIMQVLALPQESTFPCMLSSHGSAS
jgi:hypothetical protein